MLLAVSPMLAVTKARKAPRRQWVAIMAMGMVPLLLECVRSRVEGIDGLAHCQDLPEQNLVAVLGVTMYLLSRW